jgi:hypothetical protein
MCVGLYLQRLLFLSDFHRNLEVLTNYNKSSKYEMSRKCVQWESRCCMHTEDIEKLTAAFRYCFANAPKTWRMTRTGETI